MNKIKIDIPIIVEGKYDEIKLQSIIDGQIIRVDGFSFFSSKENQNYVRKVAQKHGVIVLTDSDGAGLVIRNHIKSIVPKDKIYHIYTPQIKGKEKRKSAPSKEGFLGVEGQSVEVLQNLFLPFISSSAKENTKKVTKLDFFEDGISGSINSKEKRDWLKKRLDLPMNISSNALLNSVNLLLSYEEYKAIIKESENV